MVMLVYLLLNDIGFMTIRSIYKPINIKINQIYPMLAMVKITIESIKNGMRISMITTILTIKFSWLRWLWNGAEDIICGLFTIKS